MKAELLWAAAILILTAALATVTVVHIRTLDEIERNGATAVRFEQ